MNRIDWKCIFWLLVMLFCVVFLGQQMGWAGDQWDFEFAETKIASEAIAMVESDTILQDIHKPQFSGPLLGSFFWVTPSGWFLMRGRDAIAAVRSENTDITLREVNQTALPREVTVRGPWTRGQNEMVIYRLPLDSGWQCITTDYEQNRYSAFAKWYYKRPGYCPVCGTKGECSRKESPCQGQGYIYLPLECVEMKCPNCGNLFAAPEDTAE